MALTRGDDCEVSLIQLGAERFDRRLDGGRILGGPLRQRRVAGLIHFDES
jgi:hypothetical protein